MKNSSVLVSRWMRNPGKVLAQRVAYEVLVEEDAALVGVAFEVDAEHVVNLALLDLGSRIKVANSGDACEQRRGAGFFGNGEVLLELDAQEQLVPDFHAS